MSELDAKTLDASMWRYVALRRRYRRLFLGGMALAIACTAVGDLLHMIEGRFKIQTDSVLHGLLSVPAVLLCAGVCVCLGGCFITQFSLWKMSFSVFPFCCPRCGKWFAFSGWGWFTDRCKHCGLDLGPTAMTTARPLLVKPEPLSSKAGIWDRELDGTP
jgi:hypothetical protein